MSFTPLAVCTALTELVLNDTNAQHIVQVGIKLCIYYTIYSLCIQSLSKTFQTRSLLPRKDQWLARLEKQENYLHKKIQLGLCRIIMSVAIHWRSKCYE